MTDRKFTFTIEQIKKIYSAGIRRGNEEATAFEWGESASGSYYGECVMAVHDIVNESFKWDETGYTNYQTIEKWFKEK
jgi:hypothetical protein